MNFLFHFMPVDPSKCYTLDQNKESQKTEINSVLGQVVFFFVINY